MAGLFTAVTGPHFADGNADNTSLVYLDLSHNAIGKKEVRICLCLVLLRSDAFVSGIQPDFTTGGEAILHYCRISNR